MKKCTKCLIEKNINKFEKWRSVCFECRHKNKRKIKYEVIDLNKVCKKCNIEKTKDNFNIDRTKIGGLHSYCNLCRSKLNKNIYIENSKEIKTKNLEYYKNNKTKQIASMNKRAKIRRKTDPIFLLKRRLRNRLWYALHSKGWGKNNKFVEYIGCTQNELLVHIEKQFTEGMSWLNAGKWHIDHIIPLSSAQTEEEMYKLCHYTNLQPMWALDNIKKGNK